MRSAFPVYSFLIVKKFFLIVGSVFFLSGLTVPSVIAQQREFSYDERPLISLYTALIRKGTSDSYIEKRLEEEKIKIRKLAEKEARSLSQQSTLEAGDKTLKSAIDRQRSIVGGFEEELRDLKVDADILREEEQKYYITNFYGTGSVEDLRTTKSHPELLAKKAVLDERIAAMQSELTLQNDRLSKLTSEQRIDEVKKVFTAFRYLFILLLAIIIDRQIRKRFLARIQDKNRRYLIAKLTTIGIYALAIFWVFTQLLADHPGALAGLAIVGAGIAVALQDVVKDVVAWVIIIQRNLFKLGHRVTIGQFTGDVIDLTLLRTTMLEVSVNGPLNAHERTGKVLTLPNSMVLREPVLNYNATSDFMSVELKVTVTYESDWKKAQAILDDVLKKETSEFVEDARRQQKRRTALYYTAWEVGEPEVHVDLAESGILFTLKFTVPIGRKREITSKLTRSILEHFDVHDAVDIAFNTIRIVGSKTLSR